MAKVFIGVGHGAKPDGTYDPGAVAADGTQEHVLNHAIADAAAEALERSGVTVYLEQDAGTGHDPNFVGSVKTVNAGGFDCAVEVHHDWIKAPRGGFGLWASAKGEAISDAIDAAYGKRNLVLRSYPGLHPEFAFLSRTNVPAVIWECDRVGDGDTPEELDDKGEAIAEGVCTWLGVPFVGEEQPAPPPAPAPARRYVRRTVVLFANGAPEEGLAYALADRWHFRVGRVQSDGSITILRRDGSELADVDVRWGVYVGGAARRAAPHVKGGSTALIGESRRETARKVLAALVGPKPDRRRPWIPTARKAA